MAPTFQIHYFASASSYTGKDTERLRAPLPLSSLFDTLEALYPGIREKVLSSCSVSVGDEYVDVPGMDGSDGSKEGDGVVIQEGDEVAIIPPMADVALGIAKREDPYRAGYSAIQICFADCLALF
ncbi:hypothetical protein BJX63DRAFT_432791 [Aspergillus granulosus]|uniref:Uncharacterized protein n=1 Tax=Aspergillus granulosus TaxID=176169 RepID=A0ABR4H9M0_9EURO